MILSELIGAIVVEGGHRVGRVSDLRLILDEAVDATDPFRNPMPAARLYGVVVSRGAPASFLGYERSGVSRPWPLAQLLRRRERGAFLLLWSDIEQLTEDGVLVRPGARRWSAALPPTSSRRRRGH